MSALDLSELDALIKSIEDQVDLVRLGSSNGLQPASTTQPNTGEVLVAAPLNRSRANPLCFAENEYPQRTPGALDDYFSGIEQSVTLVSATVSTFTDLTNIHAQGQCPSFMVDMLASAKGNFSGVSRPELSDLSYHLETCWPDEDIKETDGAPLNMDARFERARRTLDLYRRAAQQLREAEAWCQQ